MNAPRRIQPSTTMRRCLGYCNQEFRSTGPHHRICSKCSTQQSQVRTGRIVSTERIVRDTRGR